MSIEMNSDDERYANESFENDSDMEIPEISDSENSEIEDGIQFDINKDMMYPYSSMSAPNMDVIPFATSSEDEEEVVIGSTIAEINAEPKASKKPSPKLFKKKLLLKNVIGKTQINVKTKLEIEHFKENIDEINDFDLCDVDSYEEHTKRQYPDTETDIAESARSSTYRQEDFDTKSDDEESIQVQDNLSSNAQIYNNDEDNTNHEDQEDQEDDDEQEEHEDDDEQEEQEDDDEQEEQEEQDEQEEEEEEEEEDNNNNEIPIHNGYNDEDVKLICKEFQLLTRSGLSDLQTSSLSTTPEYNSEAEMQFHNHTSDDTSRTLDSVEYGAPMIINENKSIHKMNFPSKSRNLNRKSWSFSNERMREIERQNQILLNKILTQKTTIDNSNRPKQVKQKKPLPPTTRVASAAVNRRKQQRQIDLDNQVLKRKIEAISVRKPVMNKVNNF